MTTSIGFDLRILGLGQGQGLTSVVQCNDNEIMPIKTAFIRMLGLLNRRSRPTFLASELNWGLTKQFKNLKTPWKLQPISSCYVLPITHKISHHDDSYDIMCASRCRNTRISSDLFMRFLRPSVRRPQTWENAFNKGLWCRRTEWRDQALTRIHNTHASAVPRTAADLKQATTKNRPVRNT